MSQEDTFNLLRELGGEALTGDIRKLAESKYPDRTLYSYVGQRLRKLQKWGYVKREGDKWIILREYPHSGGKQKTRNSRIADESVER